MLDVAHHLIADAAATVDAAGLTPSQAILAVLGPFATLISSLSGLFLKRHFRHLDAIEADLKARASAELARAKVDAEIAAELRLSRESREAHGRRLTELEDKLAAKIEDSRFTEVREALQDVRAEIAGGGVGVSAQMASDDLPPPPRARARAQSVPDGPGSVRAQRR